LLAFLYLFTQEFPLSLSSEGKNVEHQHNNDEIGANNFPQIKKQKSLKKSL